MNNKIFEHLLGLITEENKKILNEVLSAVNEEEKIDILTKKYSNHCFINEDQSFILPNDAFMIELFSENLTETFAIEDLVCFSIRSDYEAKDYNYLIYNSTSSFYGTKKNNRYKVTCKDSNNEFSDVIQQGKTYFTETNVLTYLYSNCDLDFFDLDKQLNLLFDVSFKEQPLYKDFYNIFNLEKNLLLTLGFKG